MKNKRIYLILISSLFLTACGNSYTKKMESSSTISKTYTDTKSSGMSNSSSDNGSANNSNDSLSINGAFNEETSPSVSIGENVPKVETSNLNNKVIKNGYLNIQTLTFEETRKEILSYTYNCNGFVETMNKNNYNDTKNLSIVVRIPSEHFDNFMNISMKNGSVLESSINTQDITNVYVDNQNRLNTLQVRHDRLLELMTKSDDLDKLFKIEQELSDVNYEIESIKGTLNHYDNLVDYSTITINVLEVKNVSVSANEETFLQKIKYQTKEALLVTKNTFESLIIKAVYLLIILALVVVPIGVIGVLLTWIIIKIFKKIKKPNSTKNNNDEDITKE